MKKQTNKNRKTKFSPQLNSKALKNKNDTGVPDGTRKAVREAKKRLRYYFLTKKQRQEVERNGLGWESAIKTLESLNVLCYSLFFCYASTRLGLTLYQFRALLAIMYVGSDSVMADDVLPAISLANNASNRLALRKQVNFLLDRGFLKFVSFHSYCVSDYSYYVLEQLLKDFKDLHISTPSAVDSRRA